MQLGKLTLPDFRITSNRDSTIDERMDIYNNETQQRVQKYTHTCMGS